tara:strand:- start:6163 stop:6441 length:279 start_codon:yes stop_codon:yes gene_type:complete
MNSEQIEKLITLRDKIEKMDKKSHIEILKILKNKDIDYSENKNGIFLNLSTTDNKIIMEIEKYIDYFNKQERLISDVENKKHSLEQSYFNQS